MGLPGTRTTTGSGVPYISTLYSRIFPSYSHYTAPPCLLLVAEALEGIVSLYIYGLCRPSGWKLPKRRGHPALLFSSLGFGFNMGSLNRCVPQQPQENTWMMDLFGGFGPMLRHIHIEKTFPSSHVCMNFSNSL